MLYLFILFILYILRQKPRVYKIIKNYDVNYSLSAFRFHLKFFIHSFITLYHDIVDRARFK